MTISFEAYLEDILDAHIGLMSSNEITSARHGYNAFIAKPAKSAVHQDSGLKLGELRSKVERFVSSARITIERNKGKDLTMIRTFAAKAESTLKGRCTKASLLALITLNSEASRHINNQV